MNPTFAYDAVEYPSAALRQAHPSHLFAVAHAFGLNAVPPERCRYLEVGCGDGTHLIAAAIGLPEATFVGLDLSSAAIGRGKQMIAELKLTNVTLHECDLTMWEPAEFDYAVAHGLYSWVPEPVRDALLSLLARSLHKQGIGYVSYNTYPGCYVRRMLWEMFHLHTANQTNPSGKMRGALELAQFLSTGKPKKADAALSLLDHELKEILENRDPRVLYHDDLGEINDPVYFHEFMAHAKEFGFRFVAEAEPHLMETRGFPPNVSAQLNGLAAKDVSLKEQYVDFLLCRRFRQTLLSTDGQSPREDPNPTRITSLSVSGNPTPDSDGGGTISLEPKVAVTFRATGGAIARTDLPIAKAAMSILASRWPARISFNDLVKLASEKLGRVAESDEIESLANLLTATWMVGLIELHGHTPKYVEEVSDRPVASPLARLQLKTQHFATTLLHTTMRFDDEPSRNMVRLLDGSRNRKEIAAEMLSAFPLNNRPTPDSLNAALDQNLKRLAKSGMLVG